MKEEYENASKKRDYHFEEEVLEFLRSFVRDNERKIESARKRLDLVEDNPEMEAKVCIYLNPSSVYISKGRVSSRNIFKGGGKIQVLKIRWGGVTTRVWQRTIYCICWQYNVSKSLVYTCVLNCPWILSHKKVKHAWPRPPPPPP